MDATALATATLLRTARARAGFSQRELAERARTSQPAIARYERARATPDLATIERLVGACGLALELKLGRPVQGDHALIREHLRRSPAARVAANRAATRMYAQAARARREGRVRPLGDA
jgi:transcriptional regulator with XRE-family HTH domain